MEASGTLLAILLQNAHECEYARFWCFVYQVIYFTQNSSMWYWSHFSRERAFQQLHQVPWICFPTLHFTLGCTIKEAEGFLHCVSDRKQNTLDLNDKRTICSRFHTSHPEGWKLSTRCSLIQRQIKGPFQKKRRFKKTDPESLILKSELIYPHTEKPRVFSSTTADLG